MILTVINVWLCLQRCPILKDFYFILVHARILRDGEKGVGLMERGGYRGK